MRLFGASYSRDELLRRIGGLPQVAGAQMLSYEEGHARNVRFVDVRTGSGFRFSPVIERGLDVGSCEYRGVPLCWVSPNGLSAPWFYEGVLDELAWARVALGGLFNTAGLLSIGPPQEIQSAQYSSIMINTGTHGRIAVTPASAVTYGEKWDGDACTIWVEGSVRQYMPYGENLLLERRYECQLGGDSFTLRDTVRNEGYFPAPHQILYHFNIGFPLLSGAAQLLAPLAGDVHEFSFSAAAEQGDANQRFARISDPQAGFAHEGFVVPLAADAAGTVGLALVNRALLDGGLGIYLRYSQAQLPVMIVWRMMAEGLYVYGIEPASSPFGSVSELSEQGWPVMLDPGETRTYELEFGVLSGAQAIDDFAQRADLSSTALEAAQ